MKTVQRRGAELAEQDLGFFRAGGQRIPPLRILARVVSIAAFELLGHVLHDLVVPILAAKLHGAVGGQRVEALRSQPHDGHVERAAAEIVNQGRHLAVGKLQRAGRAGAVELSFQRVGQRRGGGLVDDLHDLQPGDAAGVFGRLATRVVEESRHGNHGLGDLADAALRILLELLENDRRKRLRPNCRPATSRE